MHDLILDPIYQLYSYSYLPIPLSSLSTSGPEHRPCQENDVHHKIKDEQQDTEQIQSIYQWMNTREKEGHFLFKPLDSKLIFFIGFLSYDNLFLLK